MLIPPIRRWLMAAVLLLVMVLSMADPAYAVFVKLCDTMPSFGSVQEFQISSDSRYVVYRANQDASTTVELYSVPLNAGRSGKLNDALSDDANVVSFQISADSGWVVYQVSYQNTRADELYGVPISGGKAVRLTPALADGSAVTRFELSPDGKHVIYLVKDRTTKRCDDLTTGACELYSVPIVGPATGGAKLNLPLVTGGKVHDFQISPDSKRVVYRADQQTDGVDELYSVAVNGPASSSIKLNGGLAPGKNVLRGFQISPDSRRVVYVADQDVDQVFELYSVPLTGPASSSVKLNGGLAPGAKVFSGFQISTDSRRVAYLVSQSTAGADELYSVPLGGGPSIKLHGAPGITGSVFTFEITPDSGRLVYVAEQGMNGMFTLFSVPLMGPANSAVQLSGSMVAGGEVSLGFEISPDSRYVVYRANQDAYMTYELYSVPLTGPASAGVKLNGTLAAGSKVADKGFQIDPDSRQVVYLADQQIVGVQELYSVPVAGPASAGVKLNGPLVAGGQVANPFSDRNIFAISPDNQQVVYIADEDMHEVFELYAANETQPWIGFHSKSVVVSKHVESTTLTVELSAASAMDVTVDYTITGDRAQVASQDAILGTGTISFAPGETSKIITVVIGDDARYRANKTVVVALCNPTNAKLSTGSTITLTLEDSNSATLAENVVYLPLLQR